MNETYAALPSPKDRNDCRKATWTRTPPKAPTAPARPTSALASRLSCWAVRAPASPRSDSAWKIAGIIL